MAAPTIYKSGDANAPVLTGTAGDLVNLLDKCLVDGYTGQAGAGWTKAFTASNQRVYRPGAGNQFYLDVDDRGASSVLTGASGKEAAVRGYEVMTAVSTGSNFFPTTVQLAANTANWRKSATADSFPRGWILAADNRSFFIAILDGDIANAYKCYYFGDLYSLLSGDSYKTIVTTRSVVNGTGLGGSFLNQFGSSLTSGLAGHYIARLSTGVGTAIVASSVIVGSTIPVEFAVDNNAYLSRVLTGGADGLRGWFRGVYAMLSIGPSAQQWNGGDTILGTGDFAGRAFQVVYNVVGGNECMAIETTQWDTSS